MKLPGLGIYSSRAIVCMSFSEKVPMVDEASGRVLRRLLGIRATKPAYSYLSLLSVASYGEEAR